MAALEYGHRFVDGTAGPEESRDAALALAFRFKPGFVEIVYRETPGIAWVRDTNQPHTADDRMDQLADHIRILTELNNWRGNRLVEVGEHPNPPRTSQGGV